MISTSHVLFKFDAVSKSQARNQVILQDMQSLSAPLILHLVLLIFQPKDLPQQMDLPERPLAAQQRRRRLVPVLRLAHLRADLLIRARHARECCVVHDGVEALGGEPREAGRLHDLKAGEPQREVVQGLLQLRGLRRPDAREDLLCR